jgi:hypothetical protein
MKLDRRTLISALSVMIALATPLQPRAAQDQPQQKQSPPSPAATANYNFLIASGFLCDPPGGDVCPAVARASNGETIEISGAGTLAPAGKSVTAAGAFTEKTADGYVVTTGVWTSTGLMSFESYGLAPGALQRDYPQFRAPGASPMGKMPGPVAAMIAGPMAAGGAAVIRIRLLPDAGKPTDAVLRVNCAKGKAPEGEQSDGIRLTIAGGLVFSEQVSGRTVFLLQRPGFNFSWKGVASADGER